MSKDYDNLTQEELDDLASNTIGGNLGGVCAQLGNTSGEDASEFNILRDLEYTTDAAYKTDAKKLSRILNFWADQK